MTDNLDLYCDGGIIGRNPSKFGGTWAWCLIRGGRKIRYGSGIVTPKDIGMPFVTNNLTELLAAVRALESTGELLTLWTDSKVTMYRLQNGLRRNDSSVPPWLRKRTQKLHNNQQWQIKLVAGHPTKEELTDGKSKRNGLIVSVWNVWCDRECSQLAAKFLQETWGKGKIEGHESGSNGWPTVPMKAPLAGKTGCTW